MSETPRLTPDDWDRIATAISGWVNEVGSSEVADYEATRDKVLGIVRETPRGEVEDQRR